MNRILKFKIDKYEPTSELVMSDDSKILFVGNQHEEIYVWFEIGVSNSSKNVRFISVNTGDKVPENCDYLGTVILHGGVYVRHVYVSKT